METINLENIDWDQFEKEYDEWLESTGLSDDAWWSDFDDYIELEDEHDHDYLRLLYGEL